MIGIPKLTANGKHRLLQIQFAKKLLAVDFGRHRSFRIQNIAANGVQLSLIIQTIKENGLRDAFQILTSLKIWIHLKWQPSLVQCFLFSIEIQHFGIICNWLIDW